MKIHMRNFEKVVTPNMVVDELELPSLKPSDVIPTVNVSLSDKVDDSYQLSQRDKNLFSSHLTALTKIELDLVSMGRKIRLAQAFFYSLYEESKDERFKEVYDTLRSLGWYIADDVSKMKENWTGNLVALYFQYVRGL